MRKEYSFATYYRVLGMIFILLCHFTQESGNPYLNMSAQFFNIGVPMFIILSGFLFGTQRGQSGNVIQWLGKRLRRIYVPYELFVVILLVIHLICGRPVLRMDWLWLVLGMQGSVVGVQGAGQTWFITSILLCYLATPLFDKCCDWGGDRRKMLKAALMVIPAVIALTMPECIFTICSPICWYGLAYASGNEFERIQINRKGTLIAFFVMCLSFGLRLCARMVIDGTVWYDRIAVTYTQAVCAFAIFYMVAYFAQGRKAGRGIVLLGSISFEVYLYHYMFCVGPVRLFSLTGNWLINCCLVTMITVAVACIMKSISEMIVKRITK